MKTNPEIHYRECGETVLTSTGEVEELELYAKTKDAEIDRLKAELEHARTEVARLSAPVSDEEMYKQNWMMDDEQFKDAFNGIIASRTAPAQADYTIFTPLPEGTPTFGNCAVCGALLVQDNCLSCGTPRTQADGQLQANVRFPRCKCGGVAVANASGDLTRTCIHCGAIVAPTQEKQ